MRKLNGRNRIARKLTNQERYVEELKGIIMSEIFFLYGHIEDFKKIVSDWLKLNERADNKSWEKLDRVALGQIWKMIVNRVRIDKEKVAA